jgi:predicted ATPase
VFGRSRELAEVAAFLDEVPSGPSGLLLEGEPGIGKTTVWAAGVAEAAARSYLILASRPAEAEAKLSFAALGDLMGGVLERVLEDLPTPQQHALQVALLLKDPEGSPPEHRAVCAAFLGGLRLLASQTPVVIAVDDLHWLDHPSAVTLGYALRRLETEPVGLLASVRARSAPHSTPPTETAGPAAQRLRYLPIGPLKLADFETTMLFLSPRTVEANLARAYRKLGVSSRAELGAAMTRRQSAERLPIGLRERSAVHLQ